MRAYFDRGAGLTGFPWDLFEEFVPRRFCMRQEPDVVWVHFTADLLIALAYFSIPFALVYFVRRRRDLAFDWIFLLFALFIVLCGITHLFGVWALWQPLYRLDGYIKLATGVVSAATAVLLWRLIPQALKIPSAGALQRANAEVHRLNADLERRVRERTAELESVYAGAPVGLCVLDRELRWIRVNRHLAEMNGFRPEAHLGRTVRELLPGLADQAEAPLRRVLDTGEPILGIRLEGETPARPGERRAWLENLYPLHDDAGRVIGINIVCEEVTERLRAEAALRDASVRKDEFLATLAHELRNPLAPIRNGLHVLKVDPHGERAARAREVIERQVGHMVRLIDDLLDVSRISRGQISLRRQRVSVQAIVDSALEASRPLIDKAHHRLVIRLPDEPLELDADPTRLAQVLANILNNAAKYTPDGGAIELQAQREGSAVVVRITDSGVGIAPDMLPRVFEMFTQAGTTIDRAQGGLGIGLSLVRQLVEMHGGTVSAASDGPGRGSTFTVRIPLAADARAASGPSGTAERAGKPGRGLRVLVVDDNVDGAETLAVMLDLDGHTVRLAHDGPGAIAAARGFAPDVILLDIGLPGLNGYEVARRLRGDPEFADVRLVAVTGWGSQDDKQRAREAGFDVHLTKPVEAAALAQALVRPAEAG